MQITSNAFNHNMNKDKGDDVGDGLHLDAGARERQRNCNEAAHGGEEL